MGHGTRHGTRLFVVLLCFALFVQPAPATDWPQWGGCDGRNMAAGETGLAETFVPGQKSPDGRGIDPATTRHVRWVRKMGTMTCARPPWRRAGCSWAPAARGKAASSASTSGRARNSGNGPPRLARARTVDGQVFFFSMWPNALGVCSSPAVDGDRVYFVSHRCEVVCLDVRGGAVWTFDMWDLGVRPSDACCCSVLVHGDLVYVGTSNGVDRNGDLPGRAERNRPLAPLAPSLIALDKKTGRLAAVDDEQIGTRLLHGQWSSPSLGRVAGRTLVFFGGGDGVCYAFEALDRAGPTPVKLKKVWSFDCNPPEYKQFGKLDKIGALRAGRPAAARHAQPRRRDFRRDERDRGHAGLLQQSRVRGHRPRSRARPRPRGAWCIDAAGTGDITASGKIWCYKDLDRSISTAAIAGGLLYLPDIAGRLHCLDAASGKCLWIADAKAENWGSALAADGKIYLPTEKHLWVLAAGKQPKVLAQISLGSPLWATPVAANGVLYVASTRYLWAVER